MAYQGEAQSHALHFDPNGPGMGLDVNFANFDSDVANFGFNNNTDFKFDNFDLGKASTQLIMAWIAVSTTISRTRLRKYLCLFIVQFLPFIKVAMIEHCSNHVQTFLELILGV